MNETLPFFINGYNVTATITRIMSSSSAKGKIFNTHGTIIIATVNEGTYDALIFPRFVNGDEISIELLYGKIIKDTIVRIEKDNAPVISAFPKDIVGICLQKTRLREFINNVPKGLIGEKF